MPNTQVLSDSVAEALKQKIIAGEWRVDERLPNEQTLAERLKVSRTTIREAVKILVSKNILRIDRGKGTYVFHPTGLTKDPLGLEFVQEKLLVHHLAECRAGTEPSVARLAAERATGKQIVRMGKIAKIMERAEKRHIAKKTGNRDPHLGRFVELGMAFHSLMYSMTQNTVYQRLSHIFINPIVEYYAARIYNRRSAGSLFTGVHNELFEAIRRREPERAYAVSREYMRNMLEAFSMELELGEDGWNKG